MKINKQTLVVGIIIALGVLLRFLYMYLPETRVSMDESTYGMQAFHILQGERSVFYYNQPYTGTLSAYISAGLFALFGVTDLWVKFVPFLFSIAFLITSYVLAQKVLKNTIGSLVAITLLSFTAPFWLNWTSRAGTGYPEMMVLGNVVMLLTLHIVYDKLTRKREAAAFFFWGLCIGVGYWIQPAIIYYALASIGFIFVNQPRFFLQPAFYTSLLGFGLGASPVIWWNLMHQNLTNRSLFHKPFGVFKAVEDFFFLGVPVLIGTRKPFSSTDLFAPLAWLVYLIYTLAVGSLILERVQYRLSHFREIVRGLLSFKGIRAHIVPLDLMLLLMICILVIFSLSSPFNQFVIEPRYISALYTPLPIVVGYFVTRLFRWNKFAAGAVVVILLVNAVYAIYRISPKSFLDQYKLDPVLAYLRENNIHYVYGEFEYSYRIVLETKEEIIATPIDNLFGANRYPDYITRVDTAPIHEKACVIYREKNDCTFAFGDAAKDIKMIGKFKVITAQ